MDKRVLGSGPAWYHWRLGLVWGIGSRRQYRYKMGEIHVVISLLHVYIALVCHAKYLRSARTAVGRWFLG